MQHGLGPEGGTSASPQTPETQPHGGTKGVLFTPTSDMRAEHSGVDATPPERTSAQPRAFPGGPSASPDCTGRMVQGCHGNIADSPGRWCVLASHVYLPGATSTCPGPWPLLGATSTCHGRCPGHRPMQTSMPVKCQTKVPAKATLPTHLAEVEWSGPWLSGRSVRVIGGNKSLVCSGKRV